MTANIIKGLLPDGHAPSVLKQEIKDMIKSEAPAADLTKLATKEELKAVTPTAEAVAKALGYALVVGENEPAPTTYGVRTVWLDTSNPSEFTPPAPVFSQKNKTVEIPHTKFATYKLGGNAIAAGVHRVDEPYPKTVAVTAEPAGGAKFAVGAVASWAFTYESQVIPFDDAVLPLTSYLRFDDAAGAEKPKDLGTSPLVLVSKYNDKLVPGGAGIGVGPTAAKASGQSYQFANFAPNSMRSFTLILAVKVNRQAANIIKLGSLWSGKMPQFRIATNPSPTAPLSADFFGLNSDRVTKNVSAVPAVADGETMLMAVTWDGTTMRGYINGVEVASVPWAGLDSGNDHIKFIEWSVLNNQELSIAGFGFAKDEVKSVEWMKSAVAALKRGPGA